jgi:hypothetical protein
MPGFFFDKDPDSHWYRVPNELRETWNSFTENDIDSEDYDRIEEFCGLFGPFMCNGPDEILDLSCLARFAIRTDENGAFYTVPVELLDVFEADALSASTWHHAFDPYRVDPKSFTFADPRVTA